MKLICLWVQLKMLLIEDIQKLLEDRQNLMGYVLKHLVFVNNKELETRRLHGKQRNAYMIVEYYIHNNSHGE